MLRYIETLYDFSSPADAFDAEVMVDVKMMMMMMMIMIMIMMMMMITLAFPSPFTPQLIQDSPKA